MSNPAPVPIERFAWFVRALVQTVVTRALYRFIDQPRAGWVIGRLQTARDKFRRLAELLPDAPRYRGFLLGLIHEPETQKLIAAAPAEMARLLRPICWMLKAEPPDFLARPRRAEPPDAPARKQPPKPRPAPVPTPQGRWRRRPSAHWPPGVMPRARPRPA